MTQITIVQGDITTQVVDAIVNAANSSLRGGGGVDGAIHNAAGDKLYEECVTLGGCETGKAKITKGYKLPARYVIHTVGPIYGREDGKEQELLRSCYTNVLMLAQEHNLKSVAFPAIAVGAFGYPLQEATLIALQTVKEFINQSPDVFDEIRFVVFSDKVHDIYKKLH